MKILVAGLSVRSMVESAVRSGYTVLALDAFGDQDLRALAESLSLRHDFHARYGVGALLRACRRLSYEAVAYTSNLENHPAILERIAGPRPIIGNPPQTVRRVRDWAALFKRLKRAGFPVPETIVAGENRRPDTRRRWLVKPVRSGGGHGIDFLRGGESPGALSMLQEYIPGKACSASFAANGRECVILGITEQLIGGRHFGSRRFRYCGNILPLPEALRPDAGRGLLTRVRRLASFLTREYGLTGVNGMDFILKDGRAFLTEVNPRYSASMELTERAYGLEVFHIHFQASVEGRLPEFELENQLKAGGFFGKTILYAEKDATAPDTRGWAARGIKDIPASGEKMPRGGPICTILAEAPTYDEIRAELILRADGLKKEIYGGA
jgi:predicted ATP-grasp superfamily ATP-dependent carboligase